MHEHDFTLIPRFTTLEPDTEGITRVYRLPQGSRASRWSTRYARPGPAQRRSEQAAGSSGQIQVGHHIRACHCASVVTSPV